jgi:hypothetical protein
MADKGPMQMNSRLSLWVVIGVSGRRSGDAGARTPALVKKLLSDAGP